jgi:hypothetical protein
MKNIRETTTWSLYNAAREELNKADRLALAICIIDSLLELTPEQKDVGHDFINLLNSLHDEEENKKGGK